MLVPVRRYTRVGAEMTLLRTLSVVLAMIAGIQGKNKEGSDPRCGILGCTVCNTAGTGYYTCLLRDKHDSNWKLKVDNFRSCDPSTTCHQESNCSARCIDDNAPPARFFPDLCRDGGAGCTACDAENPSMFFVCSQYGDYSITEKRQCGDNCLCEKTADCVVDCLPGTTGGGSMQNPMIVYFSFDDGLTKTYYQLYEKIFIDRKRTNPNLSPYRMTMFVSHENTDYQLVSQLYNLGFELASHTANHRDLRQLKNGKVRKEIVEQVMNLNQLGGVPVEDVVGFRAPYLSFHKDVLYPILKSEGFLYDASSTKLKPKRPTFDNGIWHVPMNVYYGNSKGNKYKCAMLDGCRPKNEKDTYKLIKQNFEKHYKKRVPFGINMHASLFSGWNYTLNAMHSFLDYLDDKDDVWVVPIHTMLKWFADSPPASKLHSYSQFVK